MPAKASLAKEHCNLPTPRLAAAPPAGSWPPIPAERYSGQLTALVDSMMQRDPAARPSLPQARALGAAASAGAVS
jgi:hypothetical protein